MAFTVDGVFPKFQIEDLRLGKDKVMFTAITNRGLEKEIDVNVDAIIPGGGLIVSRAGSPDTNYFVDFVDLYEIAINWRAQP